MRDRVFIAASGTGGHLMPAVLIANQLKGCDVQFIGAGRPLEEKMIDARGYVRHVIPVVGVQNRGLKGILQFCLAVPISLLKTLKLFSQHKPQVIVGVGGYVSVLPVLVAWLKGVPTIIHECETKPGLANAALEFFATRITCAFPHVPFKYFEKISVTGQPIKPEVVRIANSITLPARPSRLLIMGGSQGARALDTAGLELAPFFVEHGIEVWHQCRPGSEEGIREAYRAAGVEARVEAFIEAMEDAYGWAHMVISRSGAGSVSELSAVNIPSILVPFPSAQGNHQVHNAELLVEPGKALLCEEGEDFVGRLKLALNQLLDQRLYAGMVGKLGLDKAPDAAKAIADIATGLIAQQKL